MGDRKQCGRPARRFPHEGDQTEPASISRSTAVFAVVFAMAVGAPAAAADRGAVAVLPFKLLDTSAEPTDQRSDHGRRLKDMGSAMARELPETGTFSAASIVGASEVADACPTETPDCLLSVARSKGAAFALFGALHKSSTLIMQLFLTIVPADGGKTLVARELNFRGDNDESWSRAKDFLVDQIRRELGSPQKAPVAAAPPR